MSTLFSNPKVESLSFRDSNGYEEFRILLLPDTYQIKFEVFEPTILTPGNEEYEIYRAKTPDNTTSDLNKAAPQIQGTVKWDGCSHVYFGRSDAPDQATDGYLHVCGSKSWELLNRMLSTVFEKCKSRLKQLEVWYE